MQKPVDQAGIGTRHDGTPNDEPESFGTEGLKPGLARLEKTLFAEARARALGLGTAQDPKAEVAVVVVETQTDAGPSWAAFVNRCPHARWPLDRFDGTFLFDDTGALMCGAHFAVFDPRDGTCLGGPGQGRALTSVPVHDEGPTLLIGPLPEGLAA